MAPPMDAKGFEEPIFESTPCTSNECSGRVMRPRAEYRHLWPDEADIRCELCLWEALIMVAIRESRDRGEKI